MIPSLVSCPRFRSLVVMTSIVMALASNPLDAQTLNWGSEVGSQIVDSKGTALQQDTFLFQLGAFAPDFIPKETNHNEWLSNWRVFDHASYNEPFGYFTGAAVLLPDVKSGAQDASAVSFAGLEAYLWVRNSDTPGESTEWLLTRAESWIFPATGGECCNTNILQWSVSDLTATDVPLWGGQNGIDGPGSFVPSGTPTLQTHIVIPEPTSVLLAALGWLVVLRRRR